MYKNTYGMKSCKNNNSMRVNSRQNMQQKLKLKLVADAKRWMPLTFNGPPCNGIWLLPLSFSEKYKITTIKTHNCEYISA